VNLVQSQHMVALDMLCHYFHFFQLHLHDILLVEAIKCFLIFLCKSGWADVSSEKCFMEWAISLSS
jgi:hypothetical protein